MAAYRPFDTLGVLYTPTEQNSVVVLDAIRKLGRTIGFDTVSRTFRLDANRKVTADGAADLVRELKDAKAQWLYLPPDSFLGTLAQDVIIPTAMEIGLPTFASTEQLMQAGALSGLVPGRPGTAVGDPDRTLETLLLSDTHERCRKAASAAAAADARLRGTHLRRASCPVGVAKGWSSLWRRRLPPSRSISSAVASPHPCTSARSAIAMVLLLERKSLRREMIAINMITLGVTLLLVSGALVVHEYEVSRSAILGQITEQARLIGRVSAPALRANDRTLPEQLVDRRAQEPTGRHARRDLHRQRRSVHDHSRALQDRRRDLIEMQRRLCDELARAPGRTSSTSTGFERCASSIGAPVACCKALWRNTRSWADGLPHSSGIRPRGDSPNRHYAIGETDDEHHVVRDQVPARTHFYGQKIARRQHLRVPFRNVDHDVRLPRSGDGSAHGASGHWRSSFGRPCDRHLVRAP